MKVRIVPTFTYGAADRIFRLMPPFSTAKVFGPYCACDGQVYQPGITIDPDDETVLSTVGEVYCPGAVAGQLACECEDE